jgi:hypothetical protein
MIKNGSILENPTSIPDAGPPRATLWAPKRQQVTIDLSSSEQPHAISFHCHLLRPHASTHEAVLMQYD